MSRTGLGREVGGVKMNVFGAHTGGCKKDSKRLVAKARRRLGKVVIRNAVQEG